RPRGTPLEALVWMAAAAQLSFVIASGGDWMEAGRFLVPFFTLAAILAAVGLTRTSRFRIGLAALVSLQLIGLLVVAWHHSTGRPVFASFEHAPTIGNAALPAYE